MDKNILCLRTKGVLIQVCIHDVFKDEYFLRCLSLSCLQPKLIVAKNLVFSQNKDISTRHRHLEPRVYIFLFDWIFSNSSRLGFPNAKICQI